MRKTVFRSAILLLLAFGAFCLAGCSPYASSRDSLAVTSKSIKSEQENLKINLTVPVISGLRDKNLQASINHQFENQAVKQREAAIKAVQDYTKDMKANNFPVATCETMMTYKAYYNKNGLLSLVTDSYEFTGGAHGNSWKTAYNYDLKSGQAIQLKDLFRSGFDYRQALTQDVKRDIAARSQDFFPEDFKGIKADQHFYLTGSDLVIFFDLYEIAPYVTGIPEFKVPFSKYQDQFRYQVTDSGLKVDYGIF